MGIFGSSDSHEEEASSHGNVFGSNYEHTITEEDGTTYSGWGWSAEDAAAAAHEAHDRDGR